MHRFYADETSFSDRQITITGPDVNHIKNVLRMKKGEKLIICNGQGEECYCIIADVLEKEIVAEILERKASEAELDTKIYLFQGLPKKDKMDLIVQKAVELGVYEIVPVMMKRTIVKLEDKKKEEKKLERWQAIAEGAAKQSGRGIIPVIHPVVSYKEAVKMAKELDITLLPYECAAGIDHTRALVKETAKKQSCGVMIGPEGGFEPDEVELAKSAGVYPVTLGKRILRTETAGLAILSVLMMEMEN